MEHACFSICLLKKPKFYLLLIFILYQNFVGEQDATFCGVFDGHGPSGHKVSQYVRDALPSKLSKSFKHPRFSSNVDQDLKCENINGSVDNSHGPLYSLVKASLVESFKVMDDALEANSKIESYCSGATAVTVLKKVYLFFLMLNLIADIDTLSLVHTFRFLL